MGVYEYPSIPRTLCGVRSRCFSPPGPIDDQELLLYEQAFRDDGPRTTGPQEFGDCGEKMGEEYQ
jgi:hypothetical protein